MQSKLKNKVVIITGAGSGLGKEIANNCLEHNMKAVLVDKFFPSLPKTFNKENILFFRIDISSAKMIKMVVDETIKKFGRVDFLINNAGIAGPLAYINDYTDKDWDKIINTNLKSAFLFCKECVNGMIKKRSGHIINISSVAGKNGLPYSSIYSASKGGMIAFSDAIKYELKKFNIKIDVVCPGSMNTPFIYTIKTKGRLKNIFKPKKINRNRMLNPKDVADIIIDLMVRPNKLFFDDIVIRSRNFKP
ncbi:MAG: SDR family oxidoreductase [Candidatus Nealsonbacteria bacterium]